MKYKVNKNSVFTFLFISLFLDAYRFFAIGNRDITLWYIGAFLIFLISTLKFSDVIKGLRKNIWSIIMIFYMIFNFLYMNCTATFSLQIGLLCWLFYIFSYRSSSIVRFEMTVRFFQKGMNLLAIYGIYQVFGYKWGLPFSNPWIDGFMVDGYNWGNYISIGNILLRRANALFREPSFFSQFLALNILIYVQEIINCKEQNNKSDRKKIKWIILNGISLICTFSGTGLLMVIVGILLLLITNDLHATKRFLFRYGIIVVVGIIGILAVILLPNPLITYLFSRMSEFDPTNVHSVSGYLRMVLPYQAAIEIITKQNALFGLGIGNAYGYIINSGFSVGTSMQPILVRTIAEEGIIGGILLLGFAKKTWKKRNVQNNTYRAILIGVYLMSFMHGTWSSEVFWLLLGFLNVDFIQKSQEKKYNEY